MDPLRRLTPGQRYALAHQLRRQSTPAERYAWSNAHDSTASRDYDRARAEWLTAAGYRVIRVRNNDVTREHLTIVLRAAFRNRPIVPPLPKGEGVRG